METIQIYKDILRGCCYITRNNADVRVTGNNNCCVSTEIGEALARRLNVKIKEID